ncbi:MAG: hypothetical protein IJ057_11030 [Bacteroidales bacterium]|nr:hypothetical protein [Bacteroidales bacterium]
MSYQTDKDANTALHRFYQLLALSNSDKEYHSRCLSIGDIFFHESQLDSAFKYLSVVFNDSESRDTKKQAAEWLVKICKVQGKDSEAYEFAEFLVPFANLNENNSHLKSWLAELCNEYEQSKQENAWQLHQQNEAVKPNAFVIGGIALALLLGSISFLVIYKKKRNAELDKKSKSDTATNPSQVQPFSFAASYAEEAICRHLIEVCNDKRNPIKESSKVYPHVVLGGTGYEANISSKAAIWAEQDIILGAGFELSANTPFSARVISVPNPTSSDLYKQYCQH